MFRIEKADLSVFILNVEKDGKDGRSLVTFEVSTFKGKIKGVSKEACL